VGGRYFRQLGNWGSWSGSNLGTAQYVFIGSSSTVTVAAKHYSHADKLTCSQSVLKSTDRLCIGPGCILAQFSVAGGDPHITFAHGGKADFRGSHRACYAFVSSPGYQFAPYFQEVDFWFDLPTGLKQLVHGTFMTMAMWRVHTSAGRGLLIEADAMKKGEVDVLVFPAPQSGQAMESVSMKQWQQVSLDDVRIETRLLTTSVQTPMWQINVTAKPIYGIVQPLFNETHVHGHWAEDQRRFDVLIHGVFPQPDAHGIVGQSYRDATVRNGKLDDYGIHATPELTDSDGMLPPMTTSAQAEGAIEGVYTDYKLPSPFSTDFLYSQFNRIAQAPTGLISKRKASTSEWDGAKWQGKKREL